MAERDRDDAPRWLYWIDYAVIFWFTLSAAWRATGPDSRWWDWLTLAICVAVALFRFSGRYIGFERWRPKVRHDKDRVR